MLLDLPIALYYAKQNPKLKFVGPRLARGYYAIAFRPEDERLAAQFDAALQRIADSGRLRQIYEQWGLWNDDQPNAVQSPGSRRNPAPSRRPLGRGRLLSAAASRGVGDDSDRRAEHAAGRRAWDCRSP